ncbi:MAG: nucleotidyl transferase AbiEii/AbiGii toxin family protein [Solirubrobacterales bacterium]
MRYETPGALRDALDQRLLNQRAETQVPIERLRKRVAFERFLVRLLAVAPERWILKGAFALDVRLGLTARATKDVDLAWADADQSVSDDLLAATRHDGRDHFVFRIERRRTGDLLGGRVMRYTVTTELDARVFERFPVDVVLGETPSIEPTWLRLPSLLGFADVDVVAIPVVAIEQHVAEKLHAYTADRGERENTRVKDLVDLVMIGEQAEIDAETLTKSLAVSFADSSAEPLWPPQLPTPPQTWMASYAALAVEVGATPDLATGHAAAAKMLDPILAGRSNGRWDPITRRWVG